MPSITATPAGLAATAAFWSGRLTQLADARQFSDPYGVAIDPRGVVVVADGGEGNRLRKIAPDGAITLLAGDSGGKEGFVDGPAAQARFHTPSGIALDRLGNLYVADTGNHAIRKVAPDGTVGTLAGSGVAGTADGVGKAAQFNGPVGVAVDDAGVVYVADTYNDSIRRIAPDGSVTTIAGSGAPGTADGPALQASFDTPCALTLDADGALLIADTRNDAIRRLGRDGMVSTVVKAPEDERRPLLRRPLALARTHDGHLYIAAAQGRILQLTPQGALDALGDVDQVVQPGYGSDGRLQLFRLRGMALAGDGSLVVSDAAAQRVHRLTPATLPPPSPFSASSLTAASVAGGNGVSALLPGVVGTAVAAQTPDGGAAAAMPAAPRVKAMLWPVAPQDAPHEVVGVMGEVRGNFEGDSRDHFHSGLDVQAKVGTPVLAVAPSKVSDPLANWGFGSLSEGISLGNISYIHMRVGRTAKNAALDERFQLLRNTRGKPERIRVRRGAHFATGDTLGAVNGMAHVHLDYFRQGQVLNPLTLPFIGMRDTVPPRIAGISLFDASGKPLRAAKRKPLILPHGVGEVSIVVDAYDQVDGNEARRRLGLYRLGYQILQAGAGAGASAIPGFEQPIITQEYDQLPRNRDAVKYAYAADSGIMVYGSKTTRFTYQLTNRLQHGQVTPGAWNVGALPPGAYILRIYAADYAGNTATEGRDLPFTIE